MAGLDRHAPGGASGPTTPRASTDGARPVTAALTKPHEIRGLRLLSRNMTGCASRDGVAARSPEVAAAGRIGYPCVPLQCDNVGHDARCGCH
jgi:hypothetical protein